MFTVYILQSRTSKRYYIGSTGDLEQRLAAHNKGGTISTRQRGPWVVVYTEKFPDKVSALAREHQIKRYKHGRAFTILIRNHGEVA